MDTNASVEVTTTDIRRPPDTSATSLAKETDTRSVEEGSGAQSTRLGLITLQTQFPALLIVTCVSLFHFLRNETPIQYAIPQL
mgnify:CR=1 FL=1